MSNIVLLYHRMAVPRFSSQVWGQYVAPPLFRNQLDYLTRNNWQGLALDQLLEESQPQPSRFAATFDDAYLSVFEAAYPALLERGLTATVYVVVNSIGAVNQWDCSKGDCVEQIMELSQIREMADQGFQIGSHTLSHPHLTRLNDAALREELLGSKHRLEDLLGHGVTSLAYPYGDYDQRVAEMAREAGYNNAVSTRLGTVTDNCNRFEIPRINIRWNSILPLFKRKIQRAIDKTGAGK